MNRRNGISTTTRMARRAAGAFAGVVSTALLGACVAADSEATESAAGATSRLQALTEAALVDASQRTGRPRSEWSVVAAEAVTWRSGALGCPQPGMLYTDALVPGYRIVIEAAGQRLDYHASAHGAPLLCPADRAEEPAPVDSSGTR
jgi:hypothetical protein